MQEGDTAQAHRVVLDSVALPAVPAVSTNEGEVEEQQRANENNPHGHGRVVEVVRRHWVQIRQHEHHL